MVDVILLVFTLCVFLAGCWTGANFGQMKAVVARFARRFRNIVSRRPS